MELVDFITVDLGAPRKKGRNLFWQCPFHDDRDPSLTITPDAGHWKCFGCGRSGDTIDWLIKQRGLSFSEAVSLDPPKRTSSLPPTQRISSAGRHTISPPANPEWQAQAQQVVESCTKELHRSSGEKPRHWLANRGLSIDTLRRWQIGFNPEPKELHGLWVDRGITIPWSWSGKVQAVNVRRADANPKYKMIAGSHRQGLYLGDTVRPGLSTLLVEGEFDALLGRQEAGDIINVTTLGSASSRPDADAIRSLLGSPLILLAYDRDEAGDKAISYWQKLTKRTRRAGLPAGKDITEFFQKGGDIRGWIEAQLRQNGPYSTRHPTVGDNIKYDNKITVRYATRHYPTVHDAKDGACLATDVKEEVDVENRARSSRTASSEFKESKAKFRSGGSGRSQHRHLRVFVANYL